jgi:hypothetical protein
MKLTKEELEKWKASGEIKRMSHSNIVKGIVISIIGIYIGTVNEFVVSQYTNEMFSVIIKE